MGWNGINNNSNDEVDEDVEVKLKKRWTVGDGGNNVDSGANGGKGRCNVEETVEATAKATAEEMAVAKAMAYNNVACRSPACRLGRHPTPFTLLVCCREDRG